MNIAAKMLMLLDRGGLRTINSFSQSVGSEVIVNNTFASWTTDNPNNWSIPNESGSDPQVTQRNPADLNAAGAGTGAANLYSSATVNAPTLQQNVLNTALVYEVGTVISAYGSGTVLLSDGGELSSISYSSAGTKLGLFAPTNGFIRWRGSAAPTNLTLDETSAKPATLNTQQTSAADGTFEFHFTLPVVTCAGMELNLLYRITGVAQELRNCWTACLRRNAADSAWDLIPQRISGSTRTNAISPVTGVGTPNGLRVTVSGNNHEWFTGVDGVWTSRGTVTNATHNTATGVNTVYNSGFTPLRLVLP